MTALVTMMLYMVVMMMVVMMMVIVVVRVRLLGTLEVGGYGGVVGGACLELCSVLWGGTQQVVEDVHYGADTAFWFTVTILEGWVQCTCNIQTGEMVNIRQPLHMRTILYDDSSVYNTGRYTT